VSSNGRQVKPERYDIPNLVHQIHQDRFPVVQNLQDPARPGLFLHSGARVVKKLPSKRIFPAKKSGTKVPGPKIIPADQRKIRKNNPAFHTLSTECGNRCPFLHDRSDRARSHRNAGNSKYFGPKFSGRKKIRFEILKTGKFSGRKLKNL